MAETQTDILTAEEAAEAAALADQRSLSSQDTMAIATTRAAQEVQAAMIVAKKFPRDVFEAERRILDACKRPALAEQAMYVYPRGGTTVEGPSIRLAEVLAQNWGNIDTGIIELDQADGVSTMMAYCWDLETNTRQTKIFSVKHERHTRRGITRLIDPRDVYEMTANQGARRQRACILGVIPGDIVDRAVEECNETLRGNQTEPLADRAKKMVAAFETLNVTKAMIEERLGHRLNTINETEYLTFRKIWKAVSDNMQPVSAYFGGEKKSLAEKLAARKEQVEENGKSLAEAEAQPAPDESPVPDAVGGGKTKSLSRKKIKPEQLVFLKAVWQATEMPERELLEYIKTFGAVIEDLSEKSWDDVCQHVLTVEADRLTFNESFVADMMQERYGSDRVTDLTITQAEEFIQVMRDLFQEQHAPTKKDDSKLF